MQMESSILNLRALTRSQFDSFLRQVYACTLDNAKLKGAVKLPSNVLGRQLDAQSIHQF